MWNLVGLVLRNPDWIRGQIEEQADDTLAARVTQRQRELDSARSEEERLAKNLGLLDDAAPVIPLLNAATAARRAVEQEVEELLIQQRHAAEMAGRMRGFDARPLREWERLDGLAYDERRAKLREFNVAVTLWKRDHEPRFAIDWAFDISSWGFDRDDEPWVIYTRERATPVVPLANSSA